MFFRSKIPRNLIRCYSLSNISRYRAGNKCSERVKCYLENDPQMPPLFNQGDDPSVKTKLSVPFLAKRSFSDKREYQNSSASSSNNGVRKSILMKFINQRFPISPIGKDENYSQRTLSRNYCSSGNYTNSNIRNQLSQTGCTCKAKVKYAHVKSKCGSLDNVDHSPGGGNVQIFEEKLNYSHAKSRCDSLQYVHHCPGGGGKTKFFKERMDFTGVRSKCCTLDNVAHTPGGGHVQIFEEKMDFSDVKSKCGTMDNVAHTPGGGQAVIFDEKTRYSQVKAKCSSFKNISHTPGGGKTKIFTEKFDWSKVEPKVNSLENVNYKSGQKICHCQHGKGQPLKSDARRNISLHTETGDYDKRISEEGNLCPMDDQARRSRYSLAIVSAKVEKLVEDSENKGNYGASRVSKRLNPKRASEFKQKKPQSLLDQIRSMCFCKGSQDTDTSQPILMIYADESQQDKDTLLVDTNTQPNIPKLKTKKISRKESTANR